MAWLILVGWVLGQAQAQAPDLAGWLGKNVGFSKQEVARIEHEPVVKLLDVEEKSREVAVFAVVRVGVPRDLVVGQLRSVTEYMQSDAMKGIGVFSDPPSTADTSSLVLPESDFEALSQCSERECKFKLPKTAITEVLPTIDLSTDAGMKKFYGWLHEAIANYTRSYLERGDAALVVYGDKGDAMPLADGFARIMGESRYLREGNPQLIQYLQEFPKGNLDHVEDILYWSIEDYGFRPVTAITHATLLNADAPTNELVIFTQKQLYASHYFHARFEITALVDASRGPGAPGVYLMYLDRALFDDDLSWASRKLLANGVTKSVKSRLQALRDRLEE